MKKLIKFSFLSVLLISSQLWAAAWEQNVPLVTPEDKAKAFLRIRTLIPSMADGAVRYEFDPVTLLEHQVQIEKMMAKNPTYHSLKSSRKDLLEFSIFDGALSAAGNSEKEQNWKTWQEKAVQVALGLGLTTSEHLMAEIQKTLESPLLGKSQGIVVGLAQLLPAPLKKDFFAMPLNEKVELLKQHLPAEVISHGFAPGRLGWKDVEISKEEIIERLKGAVMMEQRLSFLLVNHISQQGDLSSPKDYLNRWTLEAGPKKTLEQWFNGNVVKLIPTEKAEAPATLILREVPPVVSMFRGFAGNDCSTVCSFPFVNSPNEYTFLIYDSKGGIKGYVQGTKVLVRGQSSFYLHTIAGPRVSTSDALKVISTFVNQRKSLGFAEVLLPPMERIDGLVNFIPVREAIKQVITSSAEPIVYQDSDIREQFKSTFKIYKAYDDAASNPTGFRIDESRLGAQVKVVVGEVIALDKVQTQTEKNSLIAMLLQMGKNFEKNKTMIDALAPHAGISGAEVRKLIFVAQNRENLSTTQLAEKMESTLREFGFSFKEGYFKNQISLISKGLLRSPDIAAKPELAEAALLQLLEQRDISTAEKFLLTKPGFFKSSTLSVAFFKAFYNDIHEAQFQESTALVEAIRQNPRAILTNGELLSLMALSPKAMQILTAYVSDHPGWVPAIPKTGGRELLAVHQQQVALRDVFFKKLNSARTEAEYDQRLFELNLEMSQRGLSSDSISRLKRDLYISTIDRYVSLNPKNAVHTIFYNVAYPSMESEGVQRAMRKLLPFVLKSGSYYQVKAYLGTAQILKARSQNPDGVDHIVREALITRSDKETLEPALKRHFPDLRLERITALRCEGIFR